MGWVGGGFVILMRGRVCGACLRMCGGGRLCVPCIGCDGLYLLLVLVSLPAAFGRTHLTPSPTLPETTKPPTTGATHIIHHFVTRQPFYLRQVTAFRVLPIMKELVS